MCLKWALSPSLTDPQGMLCLLKHNDLGLCVGVFYSGIAPKSVGWGGLELIIVLQHYPTIELM